MGDINKSIELYELIIKRLEESGNAPNQLTAYRGSLECFRDCTTEEEAMAKLAASPWYTAVAQGLALDDLEAKSRAALELGFGDVAAAYNAKLEEVRKDYLKAWDTSYVAEIQKLTAAHYNEREAELNAHLKELEAEIKTIAASGKDSTDEWNTVRAIKDEVIAIGRDELAALSRGEALCVAPADSTGKYSFKEMRKGAF